MKKITGIEIARLAGVSRSTVSRVINGYGNVPLETKQKVIKVIEELEYYPILSGQLLAGKNTGTLGFFWVSETPIVNEIQCSAFIVYVMEAAASLGYLVLTCFVKNLKDEKNVQLVKRIFMQERIDAGVFIGLDNNEPLIEELITKGKIVGVFGHFHPNNREPNRITVNFERDTGEKVINYAYEKGHRRIAVICGSSKNYTLQMRYESFIRGMMLHGVEIRPAWVRSNDNSDRKIYILTKKLLAECKGDYPTVICTSNDNAAFEVYMALQEEGISIPDQISVIGIDGHEGGKMVTPQLTTFAFDFQKLFFSLVDRTIKTVEKHDNIPLTEFFPSTLVERGSCCKLSIK